MNAVAGYWRPLKALLGGTFDVPAHFEVADLTLDSRMVRPGAAFLACRGRTHHGLDFARDAAAAGARAILWEPAPGVSPPLLDPSVLVVAVPDLGAQAGYIADRFFDAPSARLAVAGITGTNGKTTCAWLLAEALTRCARPAAYMGTLGTGMPGAVAAGTHTTPDAISVHRQLAAQHAAGATAVALEVSSHALDQQRCAGVRFQVAGFTNLSRDHLDYHGDMASYAAAKARLFEWPTLAARVFNIDDAAGLQLATRVRGAGLLVVTSRRAASLPDVNAAFVQAASAVTTSAGLRVELATSWGNATLQSPLVGDFNIDNLLTVTALLLALDVPLDAACAALANCRAPPGRMQPSGGDGLPLVIVDYAHTPDALEKALRAARAHGAGRLWCVFGCGGDRDAGKRPQMGRIAQQLADEVIVTDDNPRIERPADIVAAILGGMPRPEQARVVHDRAAAISAALAQAQAGDVVLVAGKGHEEYQQVGTERRPFSDIGIVRNALAARGAA
jgi:UDP-N-acetylmuramoyl-L-alanyl-D-glutamate--2,6-diaminopimelate ligase